jgi:ABC-2 type transport system ATP-binding protein
MCGGSPLSDACTMIVVDGLTKRYGAFTAVDDVSFQCQPGTVTGFLGPNGAGKSTTLRMICGLTPPTRGRSTVAGVSYASVPNPALHVGVLLDASAQHAGRTGREVLALGAMVMGLEGTRVDAMLELVGLSDAEAKRRVRNYSLGMRQRLGIAHALLGDPQILVLDEPANGLDPAGIHWMRGLLRDFADRGGTVLLSSHLLREIEVIADELIVISTGRIIKQGSKHELLAAAGTFVRARDDELLATALKRADIPATNAIDGGFMAEATPELVGAAAADSGVPLVELRPADGGGLEAMFLALTADDSRDEATA